VLRRRYNVRIHQRRTPLEKLRRLGWEVIDHTSTLLSADGCGSIPQDPATSKRTSFREVILESVFRESLKRIHVIADGKSWLTEKQIDEVLHELVKTGFSILPIMFSCLLLYYHDKGILPYSHHPLHHQQKT
jgi:hypothetical protein